MDFTPKIYESLLDQIQSKEYQFLTYNDFHLHQDDSIKKVTLRHDVDLKKENSLAFAKIQHQRGIKATYYFRTIPQSYDEKVIQDIYNMGHEIGYHYEKMDTARGNVDKAYEEFCQSLKMFRKLAPVSTVCMHGSPMSKFDNRDIWNKYNYKDLDLIAEPYFDVNFNNTYYLTDTGRRWNGSKVSVRDKAMDSSTIDNDNFLKRDYKCTSDLIKGFNDEDFPKKIMMTFHPQRWEDNKLQWIKELVLQNLKNQVKRLIVK